MASSAVNTDLPRARLRFDCFELDEADARLARRRTGTTRAEAVRRALRTDAQARQAGDEERVARRRLGPSVRHGVGAQVGDQ